jgi:hypothetical protein
MANLQLPFGIEVLNQKPADAKYFLSGETPYNSVANVNANIPSGIRHIGLTVNILGDEYWYKNGILDGDLIDKNTTFTATAITGVTNGLTKVGSNDAVLGGILTQATTTISGGNNTYLFGVSASPLNIYCQLSNCYDISANVCAYLKTEGVGGDFVIDAQNQGELVLKSQNGVVSGDNFSSAIGFDLDYVNNIFSIIDNRFGSNQKGIEYNSDYATNYTDRSLVDKAYVDSVATGLEAKDAVFLATTVSDGNIDLTGGTFVSGTTIDNMVVQNGWRVLVKNQTNPIENGIWVYSASTSGFTRSSDFDGAPSGEVSNGAFSLVMSGDTLAGTRWVVTTQDPITVGSTDINWSLLSQQLNVQAGTGITISIISSKNTVSVKLAETDSALSFNGSLGLRVDPSIAGSGLTMTSGIVNVNVDSTAITGTEVPVHFGTNNCLYIDSDEVVVALGTPITTANNGLTKVEDNVVLGGTLTGDTCVDTDLNNLYGLTFGQRTGTIGKNSFVFGGAQVSNNSAKNVASGNNSFASGSYAYAYGNYSAAFGKYSEASGDNVFAAAGGSTKGTSSYSAALNGLVCNSLSSFAAAQGSVCGSECSTALGGTICDNSSNSFISGKLAIISQNSPYSFVMGCGATGLRNLYASGNSVINISRNNTSQIAGHGALANCSSIFGGINHNIAVGNTNATIIGGNAIKLTGTSYIDYTALSSLAIFTTPTTGDMFDGVLVWNSVDKKVKQVSISSINSITGATNGLSLVGQEVKLGGTLTGTTTIDSATFGFGVGNNASAIGCDSIALGSTACATGACSIAFGRISKAFGSESIAAMWGTAVGSQSFAMGTNSCAAGGRSFAFGYNSRAYGDNSFAIGSSTFACSTNSFAFGNSVTAFGYSATIFSACGHVCSNHAFGVGYNVRVDAGNDNTIALGCGVCVSGDSGLGDYVVVSNLAIFNTPTGSTSTNVLVWDDVDKKVKINTSISGGTGAITANNGLTKLGNNIVLGGTLTGDTCIDTGGFGIVFGSSSIATGSYSTAFGYNTQATGYGSTAFGNSTYAIGDYSIAFGVDTLVTGYGSTAIGVCTHASGNTSLAFGYNVINGGDCAIALGYGITLTNDLYSGTTAVNKLAIFNTPDAGSTQDLLVWDSTDKKVKKITQGSLSVTATNGLNVNGNSEIGLGGTLTGDTCVDLQGFGVTFGTAGACASGGASIAFGCGSIATFSTSTAFGKDTCAINACATAFGRLTTASGVISTAFGNGTIASGSTSTAFGSISVAGGNLSTAFGSGTCACGGASTAFGSNTCAIGNYSTAFGRGTKACGTDSTAFGETSCANGITSLAGGFSSCAIGNCSIAIGYCVVTNANTSAIIGGSYNSISVSNINAGILAGSNISLTGSTYINHGVVSNLAIWTAPGSGSTTTDAVLVWNATDKKVKQIDGSSLGESNNIYNYSGITSSAITATTDSTYVLLVDSSSNAVTVTLPVSPFDGQAIKIKDKTGNALTNNITVFSADGIDGSTSALLNTDYGALEVMWSGDDSEWYTLSFIN